MTPPREQTEIPTPRSDAERHWSAKGDFVEIAFARQLERELHEALRDKQSNAEAFDTPQSPEQRAIEMAEHLIDCLDKLPSLIPVDDVKPIILHELNLVELVRAKERCDALDNLTVAQSIENYKAIPDQVKRMLDELVSLRISLTDERDQLRDQNEELRKDKDEWRAMAIELKRRLADLNAAHEAFYIDWSKFNHASLEYDPGYKPVFPDVSKDAELALKQFRDMDIGKALTIDNAREGK